MRFLREASKAQFPECHPDLIALLERFDKWSAENKFPEPLIIELWRTKEEQGDIYFKEYKEDVAKLKAGGAGLSTTQRARAQLLKDMSDRQLRQAAEEKFSWHICRCAADIRTNFYKPAQAVKVVQWFKIQAPTPLWELIAEPHGTGPHLHVATRNFSWRTKYTLPIGVANTNKEEEQKHG